MHITLRTKLQPSTKTEPNDKEEHAKNTAYAFILANNLLDDFADFCHKIPEDIDPKDLCLAILCDKTHPLVSNKYKLSCKE